MENIAEILKNAPQGLKLYSLAHGDVTLKKVNKTNNNAYPIVVFDFNKDISTFTKYGQIFATFNEGECILFPSKEHKSWDNWQEVLFKRGDIIKHKSSEYKEELNIQTDIYVYDGYDKSSNEYIGYNMIDKNEDDLTYLTINQYEYATPEEREQFFKELNNNGYYWNENTKQMGKSLLTNSCGCANAETKEESFTIDQLKPFDKVLVRNSKFQEWSVGIFSHIRRYSTEIKKVIIVGGKEEDYCVPYNNETKHLLGTTDDCPDKYKTW